MLGLYHYLSKHAEGIFSSFLEKRLQKGKEDPQRIDERRGISAIERPYGPLFWVHAASVGESQSALILIDKILEIDKRINILITTGTVTSAKFLSNKLPERTIHQFYPLDVPEWTDRFLDHWEPDMVFWMESELWPNMLSALESRDIPAALVNARLSTRSFKRWKLFKKSALRLLEVFDLILAQTEGEAGHFKKLGATNVFSTDNLKYSARPLPHDEHDLKILNVSLKNRPVWLFASTHAGEEELACDVHQILQSAYPDLLTILVPRHPERGQDIETMCKARRLEPLRRSENKALPEEDHDIYIADTLGELGLFYRLAPIACIGRSFSNDGGGGHNPIEAAQLNCVVLYGPHVQYQKEIYDEMSDAHAAIQLSGEQELADTLRQLFDDPALSQKLQKSAVDFARGKEGVIGRVMEHLQPIITEILAP